MQNLDVLDDNFDGFWDQIQQERELAYDERITKQIFAKLKTPPPDKPDLVLADLYEVFPDFPVNIATRRLRYVHQISLSNLFKNFTSTIVFKELLTYIEEHGKNASGCFGIVFNWPDIGTMVLHDYFVETRIDTSETYVVRHAHKRTYVLETLNGFISRVLASWQP